MTIGDLFGSLTISDDESRIIQFTDTPFTLALIAIYPGFEVWEKDDCLW